MAGVKKKKKQTSSMSIAEILPIVRQVKRLSKDKQRKFVSTCDKNFLCCVSNCARLLLKRRVPIKSSQLRKLARHKHIVRKLALKKTSLKNRRKLIQTGGFLGLILPSVVSFLTSLISK
jgi:hypothetical protein